MVPHVSNQQSTARAAATGWIWKLLLGGFALIGAFFLIAEHRAHVFGALPYVLVFAALLFCVFGHRHGGGSRTYDHVRGGDR